MLFKDEVRNVLELANKLIDIKELEYIKVCVVAFIFDENNKLTLLKRGPGARDEIGKLQAIGGSINKNDENFREALKREIKEEVGNDFNFKIDSFIGGVLNKTKDDYNTEDWIILGYKVTKISGEFINNEENRCSGFVTSKLTDFKEEDLSQSTYKFVKELISNQ